MCAPVFMYKLYNLLVRHTALLSAYSSVRRIVLSRMTHTLLSGCALQRSVVSGYTGNEASKPKMLHEDGNHGRAVDCRYVAHHLAAFITETAWYDTSHAHSPYRYEETAAHQGMESK